MKTLTLNILATSILASMLIAGCTPPQQPVYGFNPVLLISEPPVLGKPVKVSLNFISPLLKGLEGKDLYYSARIVLNLDLFQLVSGDLETTGKIVPGETHTLEATVKSVKTGSDIIYGWVALHFNPGETGGGGDFDVLYISITDEGAKVSERQRSWPSCEMNKTTPITTPFTTLTTPP